MKEKERKETENRFRNSTVNNFMASALARGQSTLVIKFKVQQFRNN